MDKKLNEIVPDTNQSSTLSGSNNEQRHRFEESHIFGKKKDNQHFIFKSEIPINFSSNLQQQSEKKGNISHQKHQFTSQYLKTEPKNHFFFNSNKQQLFDRTERKMNDEEE